MQEQILYENNGVGFHLHILVSAGVLLKVVDRDLRLPPGFCKCSTKSSFSKASRLSWTIFTRSAKLKWSLA